MANEAHPINGLMETSMKNLRALVDANTIIGEPITTPEGMTIIPVSKVSFGFASGGADIATQKQPSDPFGGGAGGGVTVHPVAFLIVNGKNVELLQINDNKNTADRIVAMVPEMFDKITALCKKQFGGEAEAKDTPPAAN